MAELDRAKQAGVKGAADKRPAAKGLDPDRVQLQYLDKQGHKLTLKEAYRQMCWKFHGRMPSHRKQEKMAVKQ
jgi:U4/U6.U5 tri-snRNP-associated protein 1